MFQEDTQDDEVVASAETTTEELQDNSDEYEQDDSTGESEGATEEKPERRAESPEQKVARLKRQLEREERKLGIESNKSPKNEAKESNVDGTTERLDRMDLRSEGIRDKSEQDIILKYARIEVLDPIDALDSDIVKAALKTYRNKQATPSPNRRTGQGTRDEVSYWADQTLKGKRAPTAEMRTKVRDYLAKNK